MQSSQVKTIELRPIKEDPGDYDRLERKIRALFRDEIYLPILRELKAPRKTLQNSRAGLLDAIQSGRIQYSRGTFSGKFNASISKDLRELGASWDRGSSTFKIARRDLPLEIRQAISISLHRFTEKIAGIDRRLERLVPSEIAAKLKVKNIFDTSIWKVEREFQKTVKGLAIAPKLTTEQSLILADEWQNNMDLWITDFTSKQISSLREDMQKTIFAGNRYESVIGKIQKSYGVSVNKAKFLARQETNLLMTKFKETRYQAAGVNKYKWGCVAGTPAHPVRPAHKALEGTEWAWDKPPVTNKNGTRNNPGQDYMQVFRSADSKNQKSVESAGK